MTCRTCVASRIQVTVALMLGVYLMVASRSHFNQMLVDATGGRHRVYSAMNIVYQLAYAAVQVPAFAFADRVDPLRALAVLPLGVAATSVVAPFALATVRPNAPLSVWSAAAIGALFAVNGALLGAWWPFTSSMLSNWAPPDRLAVMYSTISTGLPGGIALGNAFVALVYGIHDSTFRYSFFIVCVFCSLWSTVWLFAFYRHPGDDPGVQPDELKYLAASIRPKVVLPVPWRSIACSRPVWSVMLANCGSTTFYTVLIMYMPVYLKETLKVDIKQNGLLSAIPSLGQMAVIFFSGWCASTIHTRQYLDVTTIRKTFTVIGMYVPAVVLLLAVTLSVHEYVFFGMLVLAYAMSGAVFSGFRVSQMELAPNFVAAITAMGDLFGSLAMNVTHLTFMVAFEDTAEQMTWDRVCMFLTGALVVCAAPFVFVGRSDVQPWNEVQPDEPRDSDA